MQKGMAWVSMGAETEIHECDGAWRKGGGGIVEGAISRGARDADFLQGLAAGSGVADVDEQFGSRSGREAARTNRLWWNGACGEELGVLLCDCTIAARAGGGRNAAGASRQAGGNFSDA